MSDDKFRLVIDNLNAGIALSDEEGRLIAWNPAMTTLTGILATDVLGRPIWDVQWEVLPPEQQTEAMHAQLKLDLSEFLATGRAPWSQATLLREYTRPDGEVWLVEGRVFSIPTQRGFLLCSTARDVTEERRAQDEAQRLIERNAKLLQTTMDGYILADGAGKIVAVNPAYCQMNGYSEDELLGMNINRLEVALDQAQIEERIQAMMAAGALQFETRHQRKDGAVIDLDVSVSILSDPAGPLVSAFVRDVTERKQIQAELRRYAEELEDRVAERTAELEKRTTESERLNRRMLAMLEDLQAANARSERIAKQLQRVNQELETFSYSVSHDLKAPLRGIDGYSRLLLEDEWARLSDEGRLFLGNIRQATQQMNQLIDDLLVYSRLERRATHSVTVDLPGMVTSLLVEREDEIQSRGVRVAVGDLRPSLVADKDGLALALRNLLDNALKFTQTAPSPVIQVGGQETQDGYTLWIRDNGAGFEMEFHDRLFEIFHRLHRAEEFPGTGVGLAIVRKAMERMGGQVWAESSPDAGATFYLRIPEAE